MRVPTRTPRLVLTLVALAAVTALASGCGRDQPASAQVGTQTFAAGEREAMPAVSGTTLDGQPLDLASLRGRVVVLNAWASWCTPCRTEIPTFVALSQAADPEQVTVVGLNVEDDVTAARTFVQDFGMPYSSLVDPDGSTLATIPGVPPSAIPSTIVLDPDGGIAARFIGEVDAATLAAVVDSLVDGGRPATAATAAPPAAPAPPAEPPPGTAVPVG